MDTGAVTLAHGVFKGTIELLPLFEVLRGEHVVHEVLQFVNLRNDLALLLINRVSITRHCLQIWPQKGVELLKSGANLTHIFEDGFHVTWLHEDLLGLGEIPTLYSSLTLDRHLGLVELVVPLLEDIDTLVDDVDGNFGFEAEDALDIDLRADLVADFV